ncbi:MAG: hypothetical protein IPO53_00890 [Chitinophagaceae bacterium]|nr:hypothetical protein [Chitinophagaceae bacterium]
MNDQWLLMNYRYHITGLLVLVLVINSCSKKGGPTRHHRPLLRDVPEMPARYQVVLLPIPLSLYHGVRYPVPPGMMFTWVPPLPPQQPLPPISAGQV